MTLDQNQPKLFSWSKRSAFEEYVPTSTSWSLVEEKSTSPVSSRKSSDSIFSNIEKIDSKNSRDLNGRVNKRSNKTKWDMKGAWSSELICNEQNVMHWVPLKRSLSKSHHIIKIKKDLFLITMAIYLSYWYILTLNIN